MFEEIIDEMMSDLGSRVADNMGEIIYTNILKANLISLAIGTAILLITTIIATTCIIRAIKKQKTEKQIEE